jgi:hypothetical protein
MLTTHTNMQRQPILRAQVLEKGQHASLSAAYAAEVLLLGRCMASLGPSAPKGAMELQASDFLASVHNSVTRKCSLINLAETHARWCMLPDLDAKP